METKLFKELAVGQTFRLARRPDMELVKIAPIGTEGGSGTRYNARYLSGFPGAVAGQPGRYTHIGHGSKCEIPPYEQGPKPPTRWAQLTPLVQAAGWRNIDEMHSAMLAGVVEVPKKQ